MGQRFVGARALQLRLVLRSRPNPSCVRVLFLELNELELGDHSTDRCAPEVATRTFEDSVLDSCARWGGSALAVALMVEWARDESAQESEAPLILAVGNAVGRGVPTASRVTVASRGALSGLYSEGQVGGEVALRIAAFADAIVLNGTTSHGDAVLEIDAVGGARLHRIESIAGLGASETREKIKAHFGACSALYVGPGAERGLPFATLISGLDHASHVGRGGLGAAFARTGLKAVVLSGAPLDVERLGSESFEKMTGALVSSPRLRARAEGGTHELWSAFQVRGELRGKNFSEPVSGDTATALWRESRDAAGAKRGCPGCPTPCGWVVKGGEMDGPGVSKSGPRFGAALSLGPNLGFHRFGSAQKLFEACDELGIDAKEAGAVLALQMRANELGRLNAGPLWGAEADAEVAIQRMIEEPECASSGALGASALASKLGLESELFTIHGQAVRPDHDLASLLGQCVSANGADPMRTFPFATGDGLDRDRLAQMLSEVELPNGIETSGDPSGKGRLVWWHENFVAALDACGFCSFSGGSLVSDGVIELDVLARWLAPSELVMESAARSFIELGATVVGLRRELSARWGPSTAEVWPEWARASLDLPGVLDEYCAVRGLDERGGLGEVALRRMEQGQLYAFGIETLKAMDARREPAKEKAMPSECPVETIRGRVIVRSSGPLGERLGGDLELELELPVSVERILAELVEERPECRASVFRGERPLAAVYRGERLIAPSELVRAGDVLDLVVAVSGG